MRKMKLPACRRAADLAELLAATGARLSEIAGKKTSNLPGLRWRDVDWENKQLTLYSAKGRVSKGKVGTPRLIPFHPRLVALLEKLKERSHTDETKVAPASTAKKSLFGAVKRLHKAGKIKFEKLSHHDLRHMFATWAIESGIDIPTVADLLGHRDGGALLLSTYRHLRNEHLQNAAKKLKGKA
jgi:integrase